MADEAGESVNSMAERALRKLVEWDKVERSANLIMVSAITLRRLMDKQTVEEARALGRSAARDVFGPIVISTFGEATMDSTLETIRRMSRYMGRFEFHYATGGSKNIVTIRHPGGIKWSAFYLGAADSMFGEVLGLEIKSSMTEELATWEFSVPRRLGVE